MSGFNVRKLLLNEEHGAVGQQEYGLKNGGENI
jgi:hypothetical protein